MAKDFKSSLGEIKVLFEKINADHCKVIYQGKDYGPVVNITKDMFSEEWQKNLLQNLGLR